MKQHPVTAARLTESELDQIRTLIENRSAILLDASRERFFSTRVREHLEEKGLASGSELLTRVRGSSIEYEALLERLLTQETSFFRYPAVFEAPLEICSQATRRHQELCAPRAPTIAAVRIGSLALRRYF